MTVSLKLYFTIAVKETLDLISMHVFSLQMVVTCREVMGNSPNLSTSLAFLLRFQSGKVRLIKSLFLSCNTNTTVNHALIFLVMIMFTYVLKFSSLFCSGLWLPCFTRRSPTVRFSMVQHFLPKSSGSTILLSLILYESKTFPATT